jgi:cytochrome P450
MRRRELIMTEQPCTGERDYPPPRTHPVEPPSEYGWLREHAPVTRVRLADGRGAWLITRHDDVRQVYADNVNFSSDRTQPGFPVRAAAATTYTDNPLSLIGMDGADHAEMRRALMSEFTSKRIMALQPRIQKIVDGFVDEMMAGERPVDLVESLAVPVPVMVICEHLGVPFAERGYFRGLTTKVVDPQTVDAERTAASGALMSYLNDLAATKARQPGDDLISRQLRGHDGHGALDRRTVASQAFLLLISGQESTVGMIELGVLALLLHPGQLEEIRAQPAKVVLAVDELLRYITPIEHITCRVAARDVYLRGVLIRAGDGVILCGPAANRDGREFPDPDRLDINRQSRRHVSFGYGPHQCIGQNLARMELRITYETLFRRIPGLRLAVDSSELRFKLLSNFNGLYEMPVTW